MTSGSSPIHLAVWGSPIAHSRSPQLHAAAYAVLGLDWEYDRRDVDAGAFDGALAGLDRRWRGLSLTMPLKEKAFRAAVHRDRRAELTGAVNTLRLDADGPRGVNTDVGGLVRALRESGIDHVDTGRIVGAGATASSALVALGELGAGSVVVLARRPEAVAPIRALGARMGVDVRAHALGSASLAPADVTIGTLPGGVRLDDDIADAALDESGPLLDVAYSPWPSHLAERQGARGGAAMSGLSMLLHQAVLQVRFFVNDDVEIPLAAEEAVIAAMRRALMGD
ncbi:shikimate dehydrogenase [Microbacterium sp. HA-8]|uniref:shikimate dehydrogenase n=1 Tax=unclassified Microbacterium TaxID=2609290 RepID=UPI0025E9E224|nr:shikimate dehydrogenase [Microbacterium sp.]